jgi:phage terminase small subunit
MSFFVYAERREECNMAKLPGKRQKFVAEYLKDFNGTQAAIRAGYSEKGADVQGSRLLGNVRIQQEIQEFKDKASEKALVEVEYIITSLVEVAQRCMQKEEVRDSEGNPTGEWKFEHAGANRALELLGKYRGIFADKLDVTSKGERIVFIRPDYKGKPK